MDYDVLIVGAGFAGAEAAYALARRGVRVGLCTQSLDTVFLPFTPVMPPFPPGTLLAEVGFAGAKGWEIHARAKYKLEAEPKLHLFQSSVTRLVLEGGRVIGVETWEGPQRRAERVVLAVGSFLEPRLTLGGVVEEAGRLSEAAYPDLYQDLLSQGFGFVERKAEVPPQGGTPGYSVAFKVFAPGEWEAKTFRLTRLEGLYGLGLCVLGEGTYARMCEEGLRLAKGFC
ncbi:MULTISPECIES: FAD-dependent oxidoreductase [unclassified Meiothermus]|uniref:FAD-dependent oxidoreductase n=1 Tax=unclassified Meiothermus TaxID=370471 RepID=UPI000D7CF53A|nr:MULTISPECIES: FAD-dependent oxidoreductase [unclassified Meiothermus]PZA06295.1 tRNA uridine 5-carboxymethylaminomethyl modification protein GidA [Meiothermus sp. Pnk-1]RYM36378.1 FAD-binding protein [Meiothermus sp. PNK-Is4]